MTTPQLPPAGWYPNPDDAGQQRYWDGAAWTEHTAAAASVQPPHGSSPDDPVHWLVPTGRSGESIAAGYLGFLCLLMILFAFEPWVGPALAIGTAAGTALLARRALQKAKDGGHGRGRATFGMICAALAALAGVLGLLNSFTTL